MESALLEGQRNGTDLVDYESHINIDADAWDIQAH